ncbi:IpaD/SipD/SspD family type III secretion system needle tip protein [Paraburkholderia sp. BR10882]|uniref:IpaD/SipD/SspD family type III secretion system needle tip protein n=1 Tax=unclassified Paraburkholderia TaxID=2615204 RepID=UPI0034CD1539
MNVANFNPGSLRGVHRLEVTQPSEIPSLNGHDDAPDDGTKKVLKKGVAPDLPASPEPQGMPSNHRFDALVEAIKNGEGALTDFSSIVAFVTKFFDEITTNIFGQLGGWTHTSTDKNNNISVYIDIDKIYTAFDDIFSKYPGYTKSTPPSKNDPPSNEDRAFWFLATGGGSEGFDIDGTAPDTEGTPPHFEGPIDTGLSVKIPPTLDEWKTQLSPLFIVDDSGKVSIETGTLNKLIDSVRDFGGNGGGTPPGVNAAAYQAWSTGFTAIKDQLLNSLQVLTEKYSHQNSNFDSMSKILSSSIAATLETARSYFNI